MILEVEHFADGAELHAEVAVVGGGIAGLDLARGLTRRGVDVVVLESGRRHFDAAAQDVGRVTSSGKPLREPAPDSPFTPYLPPHVRGRVRIRQLGGTATVWTGKWRPFDELDFAARDWVPGSGWPIGRDDLAPYYRQVERDHGLADAEAFAARPGVRRVREDLAAHGLALSFHYWQQQPSRPGVDDRAELERADRPRVVVGATVTELRLAEDGRTVGSVEGRGPDGRRLRVVADRVVLATGGVEVARLLLASNRQRPEGIGNAHGLVGRFHMDHPKSKQAVLWPGPRLELLQPWTRTAPRPCFHVSIELADEVQRELRLLDHALYLSPVFTYEVDDPPAAGELRAAVEARRWGDALRAGLRLVRDPRGVAALVRRRRYRGLAGPVHHYRASMYVEQAPNADSRVRLADTRDPLGCPEAVVDWQLNELDRRSFPVVLRELADRLERAGIGRLDLGDDEPDLDDWVDAAHHLGATRMAADPAHGVVDPDCRVFGTDNLYVASSAVFPTGHSAAPTMTILAMVRRLADHLVDSLADDAARGLPDHPAAGVADGADELTGRRTAERHAAVDAPAPPARGR